MVKMITAEEAGTMDYKDKFIEEFNREVLDSIEAGLDCAWIKLPNEEELINFVVGEAKKAGYKVAEVGKSWLEDRVCYCVSWYIPKSPTPGEDDGRQS